MTPTATNDEKYCCYRDSVLKGDFVNHELSENLDSTNAFEGPEKLLEIWFAPSGSCLPISWPKMGLRDIPLSGIEHMLSEVNCEIISRVSSQMMDAYLLSESSLFVFAHKLILKTCGRTTTLFSLEPLLKLVRKYCRYEHDLSEIYRVFYSRRTFMFPEKQHDIHKNWPNEIIFLNKYFNQKTSDSYIVGNLSLDHWHFYMNGNDRSLPMLKNGAQENEMPDETLEIMMTGLDPERTDLFEKVNYGAGKDNNEKCEDTGHLIGRQMMQDTGFENIMNLAEGQITKHDSFAFTPCGFSSNTILEDKYYYTIHITPEKGWSYASFETNYPKDDKATTLTKVIGSLQPKTFFFTFVQESGESSEVSINRQSFDSLKSLDLQGYRKDDCIVYDLRFGYQMLYCHFVKSKFN